MTTEQELEFDHVGPDVAAAYHAHGVVCLRGVIDPEWIDRLRDGVESVIERVDRSADSRVENGFVTDGQLWKKSETFRSFAMESPIGALGGAVMGSRAVRLYSDSMFVKEPGSPEPTPWHHDLPYFSIAGMQTCSAWIGLDPVTRASGAMSFVPGSHLWGKLYQPKRLGLDSRPHDGAEQYDGAPPDIESDRSGYGVVSFDLMPGDMTFHNLLTLHQAGANTTSSTRRRAFTMRMAGDDVVWTERPFSTMQFETKLEEGQALSGDEFPVLWRASEDAIAGA